MARDILPSDRLGMHRTDPGREIGELHFRRGESAATSPGIRGRTRNSPEPVFHGPEEELPASVQPSPVELKAVDNFLKSGNKEVLGQYSFSSGDKHRETVTIYVSKGEIRQVGITRI